MSALFEHRRQIQSQHGQLDSHQHRPTRPLARATHTAVWTGSEMIVWGGYDANQQRTPAGDTILARIVG